ncbi:helix-turn-helix transcriptional regulator [Lachnospiraceae bacterium LCP25S3_G4]
MAHLKIKYNVYSIRSEQKMSIRRLAILSGISKTTINDIENGKHIPTIETMCYLCYALDVTLNDIVSFSE